MSNMTHIYRVGEKVKFQLGARKATATVIEDRGRIGHQGEQIIRVTMSVDTDNRVEFEFSASLVAPASDLTSARKKSR